MTKRHSRNGEAEQAAALLQPKKLKQRQRQITICRHRRTWNGANKDPACLKEHTHMLWPPLPRCHRCQRNFCVQNAHIQGDEACATHNLCTQRTSIAFSLLSPDPDYTDHNSWPHTSSGQVNLASLSQPVCIMLLALPTGSHVFPHQHL